MNRRAAMIAIVILMLGAGCAKRPATTAASAPAPTGPAISTTPVPSSPAPPAVSPPSAPPVETARPAARPEAPEFRAVSDLGDVYFDFDRAALRPDALRTVEANARLLNTRAKSLVLVEGHCDERGTPEYNIALGERRARATKSALIARGVDARRITAVSYGADKPACSDRSEACWAKNRRAHFKVKDW